MPVARRLVDVGLSPGFSNFCIYVPKFPEEHLLGQPRDPERLAIPSLDDISDGDLMSGI
jgi:hypothetical protein